MLRGKATLYKHPKANTLYLAIPSKICMDSQFPFEEGETVQIINDPNFEALLIIKEGLYYDIEGVVKNE